MSIVFGSNEAKAILADDKELRYERRSEIQGTAICPGCGKVIELEATTEQWVEGINGRWGHDEFGPAMGYCEDCGILIVDSWDGCYVYREAL